MMTRVLLLAIASLSILFSFSSCGNAEEQAQEAHVLPFNAENVELRIAPEHAQFYSDYSDIIVTLLKAEKTLELGNEDGRIAQPIIISETETGHFHQPYELRKYKSDDPTIVWVNPENVADYLKAYDELVAQMEAEHQELFYEYIDIKDIEKFQGTPHLQQVATAEREARNAALAVKAPAARAKLMLHATKWPWEYRDGVLVQQEE